jgi:hypothetical protein
VKAITLHQPWASLVAIGAKRIETRSWSTDYRGPLAIHSSVALPKLSRWAMTPSPGFRHDPLRSALGEAGYRMTGDGRGGLAHHDLPLGRVLATCRLVDVVPTDRVVLRTVQGRDFDGQVWITPLEAAFGDYMLGRFAWLLADVLQLDEPIPARGAQRLWEWAP